MKIRNIFLKNPCQKFERIIKINEIDPERLGQDLEDYVVTDEIHRYFEDILDQFIESRRRQPEWVCAWVNGYFGSGKSHFLKALAAVLGNLPVKLPGNENQINTLDYFPSKWQLPYSEILKKEFVVKTVVINLLYPKTQESPPLSHIIFTEFMRHQGFAGTPWIAEVERQLKLDGLFDKFKQTIEETQEKSWEKLRETPLYTRRIMAKVLPQVDSDKFPNEKIAFKALEDQERHLQITPRWLAERLAEEAINLDPVKGRIVLLLDEVGLYVGDSHDRLIEVQAIAETISQEHICGKVWLIVTAQEALEEKIPAIARKAEEFQKLRDRFRMKVTLTPENISTVVQKRLLEKNISAAVKNLEKLFVENSGNIAQGALLKGVSRNINIYTKLPQKRDFVDYYPFLPYHIFLIQRILEVLRGKEYGTQGLTGRERSVLGIVQGVLCQGEIPLIDKDIGSFATFDLIFEAMEQEVQALRGSETATLRQIEHLDREKNLPVSRVAKSLYLLQQVGEWLPSTADNVASVLYERIGEDIHQKRAQVEECLRILVQEHWVIEKEGKYRFLQEVERTFEQELERLQQRLPHIQKEELAREAIKEKLRDLQKIRYKDVRDFDVRIEIDDKTVFPKGDIILKVISPLNLTDYKLDVLEMETAREKNKVYLLMDTNPNFNEKIERTLAMDKALNERKKKISSDEQIKFLRDKESELDHLRHDELPREANESLRKGMLILKGEKINIEGDDWRKMVKKAIVKCIDEVFYEFNKGAAKVREDDIGKIITWTGGSLPQCYYDLNIVDSSGSIREDSPLLFEVISKIKDLVEKHDSQRSGQDLVQHFISPPYGWDPRVIRLALAALLKRGSVSLKSEDRYYTADNPGVVDIFKSSKRFSSVIFDLGVSLTPQEERKASDLLAEIFGEYREETPAEIWQTLNRYFQEIKENSSRLLQRIKDMGLPPSSALENLKKISEKVLEQGSTELAVKKFISNKVTQGLRENFRIYKELVRLDENGEFDKVARIKKFADIKKDSELHNTLSPDEFALKWDTLIRAFREKEDAYKKSYCSLHSKVKDNLSKIIEAIHNHRAFKEKTEKAEKILQSQPPPFRCNVTQVQLDENWTCFQCHLSKSELETIPEQIEQWKSGVLERLEALLMEEEHKDEGNISLSEEVEIASLSEISSLEAKIRAFANRILKKGKKLKILLRMEEGQ
ncbi:BREX system P-loop protein BrxC [Candidatus Aerophobetes bacterium]|nr:BREX system P-loop protein BrxC [Candidatus Aerophobetes bacterium]